MREYSMQMERRNEDQVKLNDINIKFLLTQLNPHFF